MEVSLENTSEATSQLYSPLRSDKEEIRLVIIEAADDPSHEIRCWCETAELSSSPEYDALSYVWGDTTIKKTITLNNSQFHIARNLYQALVRMRARAGTFRLWVDAICIDQSSASEKSSQIPLMSKIYSQAKKALIWVGDEEEDSGAAMALIRKWGTGMLTANEQSPDTSWPNSLELNLRFIDDPFNEGEIKALGALLSRDYWRRVWIIQEIVLSQHRVLMCGKEEVDYEHFLLTHYQLSELLELNKHDAVDLDTMHFIFEHIGEQSNPANAALSTIRWLIRGRRYDEFQGRIFKPDPFILAARMRSSLATDLRDKIYGIFGLLSSQKLIMEPTYTADIGEVYTYFTLGLVKSTGSLQILCLAGIGVFGTEDGLRLPTWVPDFSRDSETSCLAVNDAANDQNFRAAKERKDYLTAYIPGPQPQLFTQGIICDQITNSTQREPSGYQWLWSWWELAIKNCPSTHPSDIPLRQAFFRNLIHDASGFGYGRPDFISVQEEDLFFSRASGFMTLMRRIALERIVPIIRVGVQNSGQTLELSLETDMTRLLNFVTLLEAEVIDFETFYWLCNSSVTSNERLRTQLLSLFTGASEDPNRLLWSPEKYAQTSATHGFIDFAAIISKISSFFVTERGFMGTGPHRIEEGDLVCVLLGCPVPLIIRKKGNHHVIIGEAYVYGMMHGEMVDELEQGQLELETFTFE